MKIPKSLKLMSHTITVEVIPRKKWTFENDVGAFDPATNRILLMKQGQAMMTHTFLHELTHAILAMLNHKLYSNEVFVDTFSGLLAQAMDSAE